MDKKYDYLIVGAGLFGSVCAFLLKNKGYNVLVIEKRNHIGGNIYTELKNNIHIHKYGPHIFHTNKKEVWDFMNKFDDFEQFQLEPIANYNGELYNLPFNMHTFYQIYGIKTIEELEKYIEEWDKTINEAKNLEEFAIKRLGTDIYKKLVKEYTEKQWGKPCKELPYSILGRLPIRKEYNNNYFNDIYQGIPEHGYTHIIEKMLSGIDVILNREFDIEKDYNNFDKIIYCGAIDELLKYNIGTLEYRSLNFIEEETQKSIGTPVMNFTSNKVGYTRIIEHKRFLKKTKDNINNIITYEYPEQWTATKERYYPIANDVNINLYQKYLILLKEKYPNIIPGGRLGLYEYLNMDEIVERAFKLINEGIL
jgi:UDP-galactopyranose mutase